MTFKLLLQTSPCNDFIPQTDESSPHARHMQVQKGGMDFGRREKAPTPKTRFSIWTLLWTPSRFTTKPLPVYFTTKNVRSKAVFGPE